jgi:NAD(P)-dependent dehydrogenase (short-subunit alcohol dehydrogenase family)
VIKQEHNRSASRFVGRVAPVTAAGQGIGQATAFRFAKEGAAVGALDRNPETASATARRIDETGARCLALVADVADPEAVAHCVDLCAAQLGPVSVLVNNAGFDRPGGFLKVTVEDFRAVWEVHLLAAVNCCRSVAPSMMESGYGSIVNVSSIYGKSGSKGESPYCSVKAGSTGLTKSLAREWGCKGVRVNVVLPGLTDTPTIRDRLDPKFKESIISEAPLGRSVDPSEIAAAIAFLESDDASFITGAALEVSGGWSL